MPSTIGTIASHNSYHLNPLGLYVSPPILSDLVLHVQPSGGNSNEWNESYTLVQTNSATEWAAAITTTYDELTALKASNSLIPGQTYIISDYQTKWWRQRTEATPTVMTSLVVEPLLVTATSNNTIHSIAKSALYPQDVITYNIDTTWSDFQFSDEVNPNTVIPESKGWIYRRHDVYKNISMPTDWRHITVPCYRVNNASIATWSSTTSYSRGNIVKYDGFLYSSLINSNINITPVNNNSNTNWRRISGFKETEAYLPWRYASDPNFIPVPSVWYHYFSIKNPGLAAGEVKLWYDETNYIEQPVFTDSLVSQGNFDDSGSYNIYVEDGSYGNIFTPNTSQIKLRSGCIYNIIGNTDILEIREYGSRHIIYDSFAIKIDASCGANMLFGCISTNLAEYTAIVTIIDSYDFSMGVDSVYMYCNRCQLSKFGYGFNNNSFVEGCIDVYGTSTSDVAGNYFTQPVYYLNIQAGLNGLNFSSATHVYAAYPKTITKNSAGTAVLTYLDASNVPQYVSPTT